jgi:sulfur transfer complex TusBCD TusB component (DsrH family)
MKPISRSELRREINSFNNAVAGRIEGWWMYFRASDFAARGISQQLGRRVQRVVRDEYRINISNNPLNHI